MIKIKDPNLEKVIKQKLKIKNNRNITKEIALNLRIVVAEDKGIKDLDGLEYFTNLTELWLADNKISDISVLSNLTKLRYLFLSRNNIENICALSSLSNLVDLWLYNNKIRDIMPLTNLKLRYLNVLNNPLQTGIEELFFKDLILQQNSFILINF